MAAISGTVTKVFVKELPTPDTYENTHKASIKVDDGEWINLGGMKGPKLTVRDGKGWKELTEGCVVEFLYKERPGNNGMVFRDAKRSEVKVLEWATGGSQSVSKPAPAATTAPKAPNASPAPTGRSSGGGTDWAKKDAGAAASASVDKAIAVLTATGAFADGFTYDQIKNVARGMQNLVLELADEIQHGPKTTPPPAEKPKPATKPAPQSKPKPAPKSEAERDEELATQRSWEDEDDGSNDSPFD